jgi:hypothetical protein
VPSYDRHVDHPAPRVAQQRIIHMLGECRTLRIGRGHEIGPSERERSKQTPVLLQHDPVSDHERPGREIGDAIGLHPMLAHERRERGGRQPNSCTEYEPQRDMHVSAPAGVTDGPPAARRGDKRAPGRSRVRRGSARTPR